MSIGEINNGKIFFSRPSRKGCPYNERNTAALRSYRICLLYTSPRTEPARQNNNEISSREEKLRNLFADEPAEKQKPKKTKRKLSRFFVDDDEIDDEDFDDED